MSTSSADAPEEGAIDTNSADAPEVGAPGHRRRAGATHPCKRRSRGAPPYDALSYRIDDACELSGLGRTTIYGLIRAGKVRAMKAGKSTLLCGPSYRNYLASLPTVPAKTR